MIHIVNQSCANNTVSVECLTTLALASSPYPNPNFDNLTLTQIPNLTCIPYPTLLILTQQTVTYSCTISFLTVLLFKFEYSASVMVLTSHNIQLSYARVGNV